MMFVSVGLVRGLSFAALLCTSLAFAPNGYSGEVSSVSDTDTLKPTAHQVQISGFEFIPETLNVRAGDTVTFTNSDIVPHTATALDRSWDSGSLEKGASYTLVIQEDMSLDYYCIFHPMMKAFLNVN